MLAGRSAKARNEDDRCRRPFHAGAGFTRGEIAQTSAIPPGEVQGPLCSLCWGKKQGPDSVGAGTPGCSVAFGLCCCLRSVRDWEGLGSAGSASCSAAQLQHRGVVATGTGVEGRGQRLLTELGGNHPVQAWVRSFSSERPRLHFLCFTK